MVKKGITTHKILTNKWKLGKIIAAFGFEAAASAVATSFEHIASERERERE